MTNPLFLRLSATATRLISAYGREMQLLVVEDSGTEWNPTQTETAQDITGVETKFSVEDRASWAVETKDIAILLDSTVEPSLDMKLRDAAKDYTIINIRRVKPADKSRSSTSYRLDYETRRPYLKDTLVICRAYKD